MTNDDGTGLILSPSISLKQELQGPAKIMATMVSDAIAVIRVVETPSNGQINDSRERAIEASVYFPQHDILKDGITLAGDHIEKGARTFAAYAEAMIHDLGAGVKPYLKSWYLAIKFDPWAEAFDGMDSAEDVAEFNIESVYSGGDHQIGQPITTDSDTLYQRARQIYDHLTDNGGTTWVGDHSRFGLQQSLLKTAFSVFRGLAESKYGKAYFPLSTLYGGMQSVDSDAQQQEKFRALALQWCLDNSSTNDPEIWNDLGHLYLHNDYQKSFFWWSKAACAGHAWGLWNLMGMYENGCDAVAQDYNEALRWQIRAAEAGNLPAIRGLIHQYEFGGSPIHDDMIANHWRQRARECELALHKSLARDLEGFQ